MTAAAATAPQAGQPGLVIARHPDADRLARHTDLGDHLAYVRAVQPRHHARCGCSMTDNATHADPGLPSPPTRTGTPDHGRGQGSPEAQASSISRDRTHATPARTTGDARLGGSSSARGDG